MKHTKHFLFMAAMLLGSLSASAEVVQIDGIWYDVIKKAGQAEVVADPDGTSYHSGDIVIPAVVEYEGVKCNVTSIGYYAFRYWDITSIIIPEGVTSIGVGAFEYCYDLTSITIPESVTEIRNFAFHCCNSLTEVHINSIEAWCKINFEGRFFSDEYNLYLYLDGALVTELVIPEGVTSIADNAFWGCSSLTSITIPESVTEIGTNAFSGCSSLTSITIPEGVTSIGEHAFYGCSGLTSVVISENSKLTSIEREAFYGCSSLASITIPDSVTSIEYATFKNCSSLTSITISEGVAWIGTGAFEGCSSLTSVIIPENVTSIGSYAFRYCSSLTALTILEGVIGDYTFSDCFNLTSLTISEGVTSIGNNAFDGCSSLTSIVLPKSLEIIKSSAFANCTELLDVYCYAENVPSTATDAFDGSYPEYITLHVPLSALEAYKSTAPWSSFGKPKTFETAVAEITLSETAVTLIEGESMTLTASVSPEDAADKSVTWSSSNSNVANVDALGKVTTIGAGTATITATANDGSGVSASCEVLVDANLRDVTFMVDGKVYDADVAEDGTFPEAPEKEGYTFKEWQQETYLMFVDVALEDNADEMLYTNAPCTSTQWGDQFAGWDVLFDGDANTFFHSEYSEGVDSEDGLDHYLRVDLGTLYDGSKFSFTFTVRGDQTPWYTPKTIVVEGSNLADGEYDEIAVLTNLPDGRGEVYESEVLSNGNAYRYIRYRVTETYNNVKVMGHPYFYFAEFGMKTNKFVQKAVYHAVYTPNAYNVYYYVGEELVNTVEVAYGDSIPEYVYEPADETQGFLGWDGETYETMPAHDVTYTASIMTYEKCATPVISYANGRVELSCATSGLVRFVTNVVADNAMEYITFRGGFDFVPTYTFTTYAKRMGGGYVNSDTVSVTICWIDCEEHGGGESGEGDEGGEDTGIMSIPSTPVIIQCTGGVIILTGLAEGTEVAVYDTAGVEVGAAVAVNGTATINTNLTTGSTAIVQIAGRSVKVLIK